MSVWYLGSKGARYNSMIAPRQYARLSFLARDRHSESSETELASVQEGLGDIRTFYKMSSLVLHAGRARAERLLRVCICACVFTWEEFLSQHEPTGI